jgi:hypothetical protein
MGDVRADASVEVGHTRHWTRSYPTLHDDEPPEGGS